MLKCTDGRRLSPARGWFHLCIPKFAIQVSSFHHAKKRSSQNPGCEHSWDAQVWFYKERGKKRALAPSLASTSFPLWPKVLWLRCPSGSSAELWGERDGEKSKQGDKSSAWCGREGLSSLLWHLGSFFTCVSKTPRPDLSQTPLPRMVLSVAPGWDIGWFFPSTPSLHLLEVLLLSRCCLNIPPSPLAQHLCCQKQPTLYYQHLGSSIKRGTFGTPIFLSLFWYILSDIPSFLVTPQYACQLFEVNIYSSMQI